ncbi:hypothetical protein F5148DRAFT_1298688 [Russula earlei]|uniref:Uncharacterized protein n=1 Tax=Russula earlei TaxID=71964 RepID=A0ACC0UFG2_9AGAM|nr:hypothetical protein F5148DRAFT_1298688 [Russula earlei]
MGVRTVGAAKRQRLIKLRSDKRRSRQVPQIIMTCRTQLLNLAIPLARSVLALPRPHAEPLSDSAVTALFGEGDAARRTLINAWLDAARAHMRSVPVEGVKGALLARLGYNVPVLRHLPEAFGLVASPPLGFPPIDPLPAIQHAAGVADEACRATNDASVGPSWYTRRATLAAIYLAAELHQLTSPPTAPAFLDSLLESSSRVQDAISETEVFAQYIAKSWVAIARSSGVF